MTEFSYNLSQCHKMTHNDTKAILQILYKNFANSTKLTKIPKNIQNNIQNNIQKPCFLNANFYTIST